MSAMRSFGRWLAGAFFPMVGMLLLGMHFGFDMGHERGRLEMKCAIFSALDQIGEESGEPSSLLEGCPAVRVASERT